MTFSREQKVALVGIGAMAIGVIGLGVGAVSTPTSERDGQPIREREDQLATSIGRPLLSDILQARTVLVPRPNSEIPNYYGDEVACAPTRRSMLKMADAACGVLEVAKAKQEEFLKVRAKDPLISDLEAAVRAQTKTAGEVYLGSFGFIVGGLGLFLLGMKLDERQQKREMIVHGSR